VSFNVDSVRNAWETRQRMARKAMRDARLAAGETWQAVDDDSVDMYSYVKEVWNDYIIVDGENLRKTNQFWKVPYTVDEKSGEVSFGARQAVKQEYVPLAAQQILWDNPEGPAVNKLKILVEEV